MTVHEHSTAENGFVRRTARMSALRSRCKLMSRNWRVRYRDVNIGFLGKPVIGFGKPVLNRLSVLLTFIKM